METKHPIESLMITSMTSIESMVDVNTIIGDSIITPDNTTIIPLSKVCFGFAAGGSEFNSNKLNKYTENTKLPFGVSDIGISFIWVISNGIYTFPYFCAFMMKEYLRTWD